MGTKYGGWSFLPQFLNKNSIVYLVGIGTDISFDLEVIRIVGCDVHGFDPTPNASAWIAKQSLPLQYRYHAVGLAAKDGFAEFLVPELEGWDSFGTVSNDTPDDRIVQCQVKRLSTIVEDLDHRHIDLLKIDIEGFEYEVIDDMLEGGPLPDQMLIEFHHGMYEHSTAETLRSVSAIRAKGYTLVSVSNVGREYSFVRTALLT
ncbi:FkbM family methyltransferase [Brevundimonas sp. TWP2-3-4b1]|uniref:FkbM family methyltransferase n=1 Tax=Brevundimonas sp. TWP2-3-4b1 TaxID=2804580 RepID=UPI003CF933F3